MLNNRLLFVACLLLPACLLLIAATSASANSTVFPLDSQRLMLDSSADLLLIEETGIDPETLVQRYLKQSALWQPYEKNYQVDITRFRNIWIKLSVSNPYPASADFFLVAAEPSLVDGQFILVKDQNITESWNLGSHKPFHERPVEHPYYLVPFTLEPGEQATLLVAMKGIGYADRIWIQQQHSFWASYHLKSLSDGLFLGAMSILSLITLMLFIANRDRIFLYFAIMIYGSLLYHLTRSGYGFELIWPNYANLSIRILMFSVCLPMIGSVLFSMRFLQLQANTRPWLYRLSIMFLVLLGITSIIGLLTPLQTSYSLVFTTSVAISLYFIIIWLHAANRAIRHDRRAQFFTIAWLLYLLPYLFSNIYNLTNVDSDIINFLENRNGELFFAMALLIALLFEVRKAESEKQKAIAESKAKTQFLANMSHELRTPLNGVIGTAELLSKTVLTPVQNQYSNIIISSGKMLLTLINDILDLTRIADGKLVIEEKPFALDQILVECSSTFIPVMMQKNIPLYSSIDPATPLCLIGDEYRLRQVFFNLLSNAMKFTEHGQVLIKVSSAPSTEPDKIYLYFSINDTGIGINTKKLQHIFDQFTQADASTTRRFGGSGLGLAICKAIVEEMGGTISASSTLNKGSSFSVTLPVKIDMEKELERVRALEPLKGKNILVASDYPSAMDTLKEHLGGWGITFDSAQTPQQVNEILAHEHQYDALIILLVTESSGFLKKINSQNTPLLLLHHGILEQSEIPRQGKIEILPVPASVQNLAEKLLLLFGYSYLTSPSAEICSEQADSHSQSILIAEDNLTNQTVAVRMLENLGYKPDIANNGLEAVQMSRQKSYNMILMDCEMPIMDGFDACRDILAREDKNPPVIVALTAHATKDTEQRCLEAGMNQVLTKPITMDRLQQLLENSNHDYLR